MRKVSFALAVGFVFVLTACGGSDENQAPKTPAAPPVAATEPPAPTAAKTEEAAKPKESAADLQKKTMMGVAEAMNARDAKKLAGFYTESAVVKIAGAPADATGREAIAQSFQKLFEAFSDYKTAPSRIFVKGDVVAVEWAFNATHTGDLWGIKATEKKVGAMGVDVLWFNPDGMIKEHHVYYDGATILSQIGLSKQKARPIPTLAAKPEIFTSTGSADEAKNEGAVKAMNAAFEAKKEADFLAPMADASEFDDMSQPQTMKGKADAKKFFKEMTTAFPDAKFSMTNSLTAGDFVVSEFTWTGTHKASFFGIPATKKSVTVKAIDIQQFKDGKIVHGWNYSNNADFMQQLGLMPSPGAKPADKKADATKPAAGVKAEGTKPAALAPLKK